MKIVLNNEERKSFEGFLIEYLISCKTALESIGTEDALEMLKQADGKNDAQVLSELAIGSGITKFVDIVKETQEETTYSIDPFLFTLFNQYMSSSMSILRPYSDRFATICNTYSNDIKKISSKLPKRITRSVVMNAVKGLFTMMGLEGMYVELFDLFVRFRNDEEGHGAMNRNVTRFTDKVKANKIMGDYLNKK